MLQQIKSKNLMGGGCSEFFHLLDRLDETKIVLPDLSGLKYVSAMRKNWEESVFQNNSN